MMMSAYSASVGPPLWPSHWRTPMRGLIEPSEPTAAGPAHRVVFETLSVVTERQADPRLV